MASSGSRGPRRGARARAAAAAPAQDDAPVFPGARFADLPAADLVGLLVRSNRRASDFVDAALVLAARERRLAEADEAAARAAATEERMRAEIREWRRRAVEAEACLLRTAQAGDGGGGRDGVVVPGSRGPSALKKRMLRAWESEAHAVDEDEAAAAWEEDRSRDDALAIVPHQGQVDDHHGSDYYQVGHDENPVALAVVTPGQELHPSDDEEARGMEAAGEQEEPEAAEVTKTVAAAYAQPDEPEASEQRTVVTTTGTARARPPIMKGGVFYKMVFKALKEKERQTATRAKPAAAAASQPSLRCWLYAPPPNPSEPVAKEEEEGPGDMDEDAPQQ
ncbi:hypothetical protein HU200_034134 [Digitaria exilis]|uniref:Uncharacterized protein n=1 Tax=Digitaria exilis TaxID=1010633 RepID=A0A835EMY4_9POAL|nr:hypothetical protein HU200_034134 [Digitaria exilis]